MKICKYKKRLQIYLDGWMDDSEATRFERHLKNCPVCQAELVELEDVSSAALEIADEAPERGYWESFYARALNRIISRNLTPYETSKNPRKGIRLKIGTYSLAIVSLSIAVLLAINFLPDVLNLMTEKSISQGETTEPAEPISVAEVIDNTQSLEPLIPGEPDPTAPAENPESVSSVPQVTELVSTESGQTEGSGQAPIADEQILTYFSDNIAIKKPELILSDLNNVSREPARTRFDKINEDYRLSSSMIAAGILSEVNNKVDNTGSLNGKLEFSVSGDGFNSIFNGVSSNWGYLSMPLDSGDVEEFRRYLIELELIQTK
ncbi:MAG: zf-HC2 domain-containing protein [Candidatus Zixiibacteriota bacterium]|nr:MAG: zf-HC2 domain-containing protein [candidate division Zixibacteria bacterium]